MIDINITQFYHIGKFISIRAATEATGYKLQYLRRLLRAGKITGIKLGQVWLIEFASLEEYCQLKTTSSDQRCARNTFAPASVYDRKHPMYTNVNVIIPPDACAHNLKQSIQETQ